MNTEAAISVPAWNALISLCQEYLHKGGKGLPNEAVEEALHALLEAKQITHKNDDD